jgi:hypothetical protein
MKGMTESNPVISEDLKELVSTTIESIKEGLRGKNCSLVDALEFEVSVIKTKKGKAGFKFFVADASGNYSNERVSKIKFKVVGSNTIFRRKDMLWLDK